jgi:N-acetylglucosamine kinase-like BadF-type ATPase
MDDNKYVIGVDGGGTSTVARLADLQGNVVSVAKAGPSNLSTSGPEKCAETLTGVITDAVVQASVSLESVRVVVYGTAGAGRKADQERLHAAILSRWDALPKKPGSLYVVSDADIALEAAHGGDAGIIIISGTGSIIYGRDTDGSVKRSGGWGPIIGDPGSGTAIGLRALRIAAKTIDGCIEAGLLMQHIAEHTGITSQESLINRVYKEKYPPSEIVPLVFQAARQGDRSALDIIRESAGELIEMLTCGIKKFSFPGIIPISYVGGLLLSDSVYPDIVSELIRKEIPNAEIRKPKYRPEEGAIAMALRYFHTVE